MDFEDHSIERDVDNMTTEKELPVKHVISQQRKECQDMARDSHYKDKDKEADTCDEDSYKKDSLDDNPEPESVELRAHVTKNEGIQLISRAGGSKRRLLKKQAEDIHLIFKTSQVRRKKEKEMRRKE